MDAAIDYITRLWPMMVAFVGVVAWLVKVDGRTIDNAKTIARVEKDNADSLTRLEARIDARRKEDMDVLRAMFSEIKQDIRELRDR